MWLDGSCDSFLLCYVMVSVKCSRLVCGLGRCRLVTANGLGSCCWPRLASRTGAIGEKVDMHYNQVAVWRKRYGEFGVAGLADGDRPGRPFVYGHDDVLALVHLVTTDPPSTHARWTCELVAERMSQQGVPISASQVWRIFERVGSQTVADPVVDDLARSRVLVQGRRRVWPVPGSSRQCRGLVS